MASTTFAGVGTKGTSVYGWSAAPNIVAATTNVNTIDLSGISVDPQVLTY
jgi:hypothetical protein